jgi:hypothetical protein
MKECEQAFNTALNKHSLVIDGTKLSLPLPETLEFFTPKGMEELKKLIQRFMEGNEQSYLKEYKEKRGKFLVNSLRKLGPEKMKKETTPKKDSHSFIFFLYFFAKLVQVELSFLFFFCLFFFFYQKHSLEYLSSV